MELPLPLRQAVDGALTGVPLSELTAAAAALSARYRQEVRDGRHGQADQDAHRESHADRAEGQR